MLLLLGLWGTQAPAAESWLSGKWKPLSSDGSSSTVSKKKKGAKSADYRMQKDDPELGTELMQQLKFDVQGADIILTVKLSAELMERVGQYAAKQKLKRKSKPAPKAVSPAAK